METQYQTRQTLDTLITQQELARRWKRSETSISFASAVGVGPRYVKVDGLVKYPMDEVQRYERDRLFLAPALAEARRQSLP